jgi:DNA-directed RNA polymerase specialized sigma subunit
MDYGIINELIANVVSGKTNFVAIEDIKAKASSEEEAKYMVDFIENMGIFVMSFTDNKKYDKLTPQEEARLVMKYQAGTNAQNILREDIEGLSDEYYKQLEKMVMDKEKAYNILEKHYWAFILKAVNYFGTPSRRNFEDYLQSARMGFIKGLNEADFSHYENVLSTFVWMKMIAEVQEQAERNTASNPASHTFLRDKKAYFKYKEEHNGIINYEEVAKLLKIQYKTEKDKQNLRNKLNLFETYSNNCTSLSMKVNDDSDDKEIELVDTLSSEDDSPEQKRIKQEFWDKLREICSEFMNVEELIVFMLISQEGYTYESLAEYINDNMIYKKFGRTTPTTPDRVSYIYRMAKKKAFNENRLYLQQKMKKFGFESIDIFGGH